MSEERVRIIRSEPLLALRLRTIQRNRFPKVSEFGIQWVEDVGMFIRAREFWVANVATALIGLATGQVAGAAPGLKSRPILSQIIR